MGRITLAGSVALAVSSLTLIAAPVAGATTYNNDTPIVIPAQGNANPYPSSIVVSGTAGPITDVNVGFDGVTHDTPNDVSMVLVGPSGQALHLYGCVGDAFTAAAGIFVTLDDAAATKLPDIGTLSSGTYQPTSHCDTNARSFPAPGPLTAYGNAGPGGTATFASVFNGSSAIGTWNLYVIDAAAGGSGSIPGGWSLDVKPDVTPLPLVESTPGPPVFSPAPPVRRCKKKSKKGAVAAKKRCQKKKKK